MLARIAIDPESRTRVRYRGPRNRTRRRDVVHRYNATPDVGYARHGQKLADTHSGASLATLLSKAPFPTIKAGGVRDIKVPVKPPGAPPSSPQSGR